MQVQGPWLSSPRRKRIASCHRRQTLVPFYPLCDPLRLLRVLARRVRFSSSTKEQTRSESLWLTESKTGRKTSNLTYYRPLASLAVRSFLHRRKFSNGSVPQVLSCSRAMGGGDTRRDIVYRVIERIDRRKFARRRCVSATLKRNGSTKHLRS